MRRSTDEHQAESIEVQDGESRRFIGRQGWDHHDQHVFVDDATSRAEFKRRPGLIVLINAAIDGEFDVVVCRDETRLGGDTFRTGLVMQELLDAGVRLFYYYTNEEVRLDDATSKFMVSARNFASELEREKISQRTHEHLLTKARRGLNVGGRVYGYDNLRTEEKKVEYRVNPEQAKVVVEIFERYADGDGYRTIACDLNDRGIAPPRAGKRGTGSWSPSAIRAMLLRDRYRGVYVWNKFKKLYRGGTKVREMRPKSEWVIEPAPELRIIEEDLWQRVEARFEAGRRFGGPGPGRRPRYLLSGIARCGDCGGPLKVSNSKVGQRQVKVYGCAYHRDRGNSVCQNAMRRPVDTVDAMVIGWLRQNVLVEGIVGEVLKEVRARIVERAASSGEEKPRLAAEARNLRQEIERLTAALAQADGTDAPGAVVQAIAEREGRLRKLQARIEVLEVTPSVLDLEVRRLEREAQARLQDLTTALSRNQQEARRVIETLVDGHLTVTPLKTPEGSRFQIEGETAFGALFTKWASPRGFEPRSPA